MTIFRTAKYVHFGWLLVNPKIPYSIERDEWNITELNELVIPIIPLEKIHAKDIEDIKNASGLKQYLKEKVFPNEPCPCGSGKKYKQCCGKFN